MPTSSPTHVPTPPPCSLPGFYLAPGAAGCQPCSGDDLPNCARCVLLPAGGSAAPPQSCSRLPAASPPARPLTHQFLTLSVPPAQVQGMLAGHPRARMLPGRARLRQRPPLHRVRSGHQPALRQGRLPALRPRRLRPLRELLRPGSGLRGGAALHALRAARRHRAPHHRPLHQALLGRPSLQGGRLPPRRRVHRLQGWWVGRGAGLRAGEAGRAGGAPGVCDTTRPA